MLLMAHKLLRGGPPQKVQTVVFTLKETWSSFSRACTQHGAGTVGSTAQAASVCTTTHGTQRHAQLRSMEKWGRAGGPWASLPVSWFREGDCRAISPWFLEAVC